MHLLHPHYKADYYSYLYGKKKKQKTAELYLKGWELKHYIYVTITCPENWGTADIWWKARKRPSPLTFHNNIWFLRFIAEPFPTFSSSKIYLAKSRNYFPIMQNVKQCFVPLYISICFIFKAQNLAVCKMGQENIHRLKC